MNIPFSAESFLNVIEMYNRGFFPAQIIIFLIGIMTLIILHSNSKAKSRFIGGFLGLLWIWIGVAYHFAYFTSINNAAWGFGSLFILQGLLFIIVSLFTDRLLFEYNGKPWEMVGYFFILFGLILYPVIIYYFKDSPEQTITLGLPCPSTILTFGFLMLTTRKFPKFLLIIPTLWAIIGTGAAVKFDVYPDYLMLLAAILANIYLLRRKKEKKMENA